MTDETIHIEEELKDAAHKVENTAKRWTEQITVHGGDLGETLGRLVKEATVRKITVKSQTGKTLLEIPLVLGAAGMLIVGPWTAVLLVAAWLTRVSILIEYEAAPTQVEAAVEEVAAEIKTAVA
ncbi:MAG: DUF4342 domain-containing protein [Candidatus Promineofilum sp.]|nr:DUF4342 domain-containing protein [Promineifilum sp.]